MHDYLSEEQTKSVIHAFVTSKLDSFNSLLGGLPATVISKLQRIQNSSAKLIMGGKKHDHVTPILRHLHWLPVQQRIQFKLLLLAYKALTGEGPLYLRELLFLYTPTRSLRSSSDVIRLTIPRTKLKTYGDRAFSAIVPRLWNALPTSIKVAPSVQTFKTSLKTHFFNVAHK